MANAMPAGEEVDLLVVGGGINGVGIARDAAGRGLRVILVEQSDLAAGTSSASTKLIHGGLRYLETRQFRLVRESLMERERLLAIAPHIVHPMTFVLPHVRGLRPRWQIRLGLFLYDHLGSRQKLSHSRALRLEGTAIGGPLRPDITHGFSYADCAVDDSRLVVLNAMDAARRGARILTRTRFVQAAPGPQGWRAHCHDDTADRRVEIRARAIVNAAGPWVDRVRAQLPAAHSDAKARLVKGSHIVVPRLYVGDHAFLLQNPDGRVVFTIPYEGEFTLVGTTEVPCEPGADATPISEAEVDYLRTAVGSCFRNTPRREDVVWSYAGVRALVDDEATSASRVTRDYRLELSRRPAPLLSVYGGKLTTYRRLAESAMDRLQPLLGGSSRRWTDSAPLPGGDLAGDFERFSADCLARWPQLEPSLLRRLARTYGTRLEVIIGHARSMADLGEDLGAGLTESELTYLRKHEWAMTAEDVLWRRTKLGLRLDETRRSALAGRMAVAA